MCCEVALRYVIIRGEAYDVTDFQHPGGQHMMDLAVNRDATIMFESAHVRFDLAEKHLKLLPKACVFLLRVPRVLFQSASMSWQGHGGRVEAGRLHL